MSDAWDEGFETWSGEDAFEQIDRDQLLRLARGLAAQRDADRAAAQAEIEALKQALRERAELIATRERELDERERTREEDGGERRRRRRRLGRDREEELEERLADLEDQAYELAQRAAAIGERERDLAKLEERVERELEDAERRGRGWRRRRGEPAEEEKPAITTADAREHELRERAAALEVREREGTARLEERSSALAARTEALDERDAALRTQVDALEAREAQLAARERELEEARNELEAEGARQAAVKAEPQPVPVPAPPAVKDDTREREFVRRAAKLAARERELALIRQGLDAERNELLARERDTRKRETVEDRDAFAPPLAPLGFSEGFAAFAAARARRALPPRRYS